LAQTLTTDLEQIDGAQAVDINSAQSAPRRYQLPEIVDTGRAGTQIDDLTLLAFTNNGEGECELLAFETNRSVFRVKPYERVVLNPVMDLGDGAVGWQVRSRRETIIAVAEDTHIADLTTTAVTATDCAAAVSNADTYAAASVNAAFDTAIDAAGATAETDFDASVAEVETKVNAILAAFDTPNITAAA
jgi:hypothetical protein